MIDKTVKKYSKQQGLTMKALAGEVGMTETGLHRALKNKSLKVKTLEKISEVLQVPIAFLFGEEEKLEEERRKYRRENADLEDRVEKLEDRLDELLTMKGGKSS